MKRIRLTNSKMCAIVDKEDFHYLSKRKWHACKSRNIWYVKNGQPKFMHRVILNCKKGQLVDHINRNGLDNRKQNLRIATNSQNLMNSAGHNKRLSKFKGVGFHKMNKKWYARIKHNQISFWLGYFTTERKAALAYNKAAKTYFGDRARLNTISTIKEKP